MATLDLMTKGRIELGIGAGTFWKAIRSYGGPSRTVSEAVAALEEAIQVIRLIWNPDKTNKRKTVSFERKFYQLQEAHLGPAPYHPVEIWIGAQGPKMLNRIGRLGDGWSIPLQPYLETEMIDGAQKIIDEAARANGAKPKFYPSNSMSSGHNRSGRSFRKITAWTGRNSGKVSR